MRKLIASTPFEDAAELALSVKALLDFVDDRESEWVPVGVESEGFALQGSCVLTNSDDGYIIEITDRFTDEISAVEIDVPFVPETAQ